MQLTQNFDRIEFISKDGRDVPEELLPNLQLLAENLQILRDHLGEPVRILSGYRSAEHNRRIGGARNSKHVKAMAADITVRSKSPRQLAAIIERLIASRQMRQGGLGIYPGFVHYDVRGTRSRW